MPYSINRWEDTDILVVRGSGDITAADNDARNLAKSFARLAKPRHCLMAIVAESGAQYGVARMIETLSSMDDVTTAAFGSMDEAVAWMQLGVREE